MQDISSALKGCEEKLESHSSLGPAAKDSKHIDKMRTLQDHVDSLMPRIEFTQDLIDSMQRGKPGADLTPVTSELDALKTRLDNASCGVQGWVRTMEEAGERQDEIQGLIRNQQQALSEREDDLELKSSPARDPDSLQAQIDDVQVNY